MTNIRRIQLFAAAAIANGTFGLSLIAASPAIAATCTPLEICGPCQNLTQAQINAVCTSQSPGCTLLSAICVSLPGCIGNHAFLCQYET